MRNSVAKPVSIVGCGSIGTRYAHCLGAMGYELALFDVDVDRAKTLATVLHAEYTRPVSCYSTLPELFDQRPRLVIVATPPTHHAEPAQAVIEAGIPLLCEKPLSHDLDDARRIRDAARKAAAPTHGVCNMRFHPAVQKLRAEMHRIGNPLAVRAHFGHRLSQMRTAGLDVFAGSSELGGGVVLDCVHELDYLMWLFGPLYVVTASNAQLGDEPINAEDWAVAVLSSREGVRIDIHLDFLARYKRRGCEVIGTEGSLVWQSFGRNPEQAVLLFETMDHQETLWSCPAVDANVEYIGMLERMLSGGTDLQSIDSAYLVLKLATELRSKAYAELPVMPT